MTESREELLAAEVADLKSRLEESQDLLRAIRQGEVDALVVSGLEGEQVFTLEGADQTYRVLIEAMNDGAVTMTSDGTILYCNRHFADMTKSLLEKVIGSSIYRFIPQADQTAFRVLQRDLSRGELALRAEDESIMPVYISINSLKLSESQEAFCVVFTDLTEQKRKEEIMAAEKLARSIIDQANEAIVVCDDTGRIIRFSQAASNISGYDPTLQYFEDVFDLRLSDGKRFYPISAALRGEVILRSECKFGRGEDRLFNLLLNAGPLKNADGKIIGCVIVLSDITDQKRVEEALQEKQEEIEVQAEELETQNEELRTNNEELIEVTRKLRESEERFRLLVGGIKDCAIFMLDPEGRVVTWNEGAERLKGYKSEEIIGLDFSCFYTPEDVAENKPHKLLDAACSREQVEEECWRVRKDGSRFWASVVITALHDEREHLRGFAKVTRDITERKKAEEALRKAHDELEQRVAERTAELVKAKDAAEAATKAKAEFLANMSHEIRTPMNAVIGMTGILLEENLAPEHRDFVGTIRSNGDALMTIINDILDFSKMESDKVVLEEQPFNLRALVEESLDLVALRASEKGMNLAYTIDKNVPDIIIGDPGRLRQILGNLLSNAVKFTDEGEIMLSVSSQKGNDTQEIHFAVQDTGIGISQDHMNRLFQSFSQMEPSTTRLYGGTGLGLAISKKLVEMMGGRIWAESEPGIGSTFHFKIKTSSSESEPKESEQKLNRVQPKLVGKRVLIVSNNKTNRSILGKQVYPWGMIPMIATSGQEALNWISRGDDFDIAILDMDIQDTNSIELEKEIRRYNETLPLVLLTSLGKRIPPNHAYLTKPIKPSQLHKVLTEILSRQPAKRLVQSPVVSQPIQNSPLRILLAEDNASSQKVALNMLKHLGYKADSVANGIEALQALERQPYDVVLMDVRMPEMDGLEATRIIRQRWTENGPKVIAITAYALEGDREKCLEAGMDDYIAKPIQKGELAEVLKRYTLETQ